LDDRTREERTMIRLDAAKPVRFCDGWRRRDFLHAGALGLFGFTLSDLFALQAAGQVRTDTDKNCILLFLVGGPSQLDTWDMKPDAPSEIRGPYKPIPTNVAGIQISELFPRTAKHADKFALVRSVYYTGGGVHVLGHQVAQTGRLFQAGIESPHMGSVVGFVKGPKGDIPPHVLLPHAMGNLGFNVPTGQTAGFLGKTYDPFVLNADPSDPKFTVRDLVPPDYITAVRADTRRRLRSAIDESVKSFEASPDARLLDASFDQAYTLMSSAKARAAFDMSQESDALKVQYGRNRFGMSCLLARRLVEAGVRFVTVNMFETVFDEVTWDIHGSPPFHPIEAYRTLGPMFDNAYASLLEDLASRGLLESTMVVAMGEFGRTPKINTGGGRDHWPQCWSVALAGGGVKGGQVIGSSDEIGAYPKDHPIVVGQIAATVLSNLGVDVSQELPGPQGRPIPIVDRGVEPIAELF
jgi:hypothetical protein